MSTVDILSQRAERQLTRVLVKATNPANEGHSTKNQELRLLGTEPAALLADIPRLKVLTLMVYTDLMVTDKDITELQTLLVKWCQQQNWYDRDLEHIDRRVQGITANAILNLTPNDKQKLSALQMAKNTGISSTAFYKKWQTHQQQLEHQLQDWLIDAANSLHKNASFMGRE